MAKAPAFQVYAGDFLSDPKTLVMSAEEIGVYWLLILACWKDNGLPKETKKLSRLARVGEKKFFRLWTETISDCFYFDEKTQRYRHKRLDQELKNKEDFTERQTKAAYARWGKRQCRGIPDAMPRECSSTSTSTSLSKNSYPPGEKNTHEGEIPNSVESASPKISGLGKQVREVFACWQEIHRHPNAKLDKKREAAIRARLVEGYSLERIQAAIRGIRGSPYHMGKNEHGTVYDDIELICRSGKNVDRFADLEEKQNGTFGQGSWEDPERSNRIRGILEYGVESATAKRSLLEGDGGIQFSLSEPENRQVLHAELA